MQRQRGKLVPISDAFSDLNGAVKAIRDATPQALHHFTRFDQVNQLVRASEADADLGFMARRPQVRSAETASSVRQGSSSGSGTAHQR